MVGKVIDIQKDYRNKQRLSGERIAQARKDPLPLLRN